MWPPSKTGRIEVLFVFKHIGDGYVPVGQIVFEGRESGRRHGRFAYAPSYIERRTGRPIDPVSLPLSPKWKAAYPEEVQLAFHDSGPDGWGKGLLDMDYPSIKLGMAEYLASGGARRTGDLAYGPTPEGPETWVPDDRALIRLPSDNDDVEALLDAARAADEGEASADHLALLLRSSADLGGARPKARLRHDGRDWIAKFSTWGDTFDNPKMEAVSLDVAEAAGIETPDHRLLTLRGRSILLVRRFDRDSRALPLAYLSAGTLLKQPSTDYGTRRSYLDIALVGKQIGAPDTIETMFRRFLLNSLLRNTDDHLRNHGFVNDADGWRLSPVFDIVPHVSGLRHVCAPAPGLSPEWDPTKAFSAHEKFGIPRSDAERIWSDVARAIERMPDFMQARDVSRSDSDLILAALALRDERGLSKVHALTEAPVKLIVTKTEVEATLALLGKIGKADFVPGDSDGEVDPLVTVLAAAGHAVVLRWDDEAAKKNAHHEFTGLEALHVLRDGFGRRKHRSVQIDMGRVSAALSADDFRRFRELVQTAADAVADRKMARARIPTVVVKDRGKDARP